MNESDHSSTLGVGRVEICYNNSFWAVCDDRWDILDAGVVCRQLGILSSSNTDFCDQLYMYHEFCVNHFNTQLQFLLEGAHMAVGQCPSFLTTLSVVEMSPTSSSVSTVGLEYTTVSPLRQLELFVEVFDE